MKPYGQKHASRVCECIQCGKQKKGAFSKRARRKAKEEISNGITDAGLQHNEGPRKKAILRIAF